MISQDRDYEDILRDALRAAAESVEPAVDGLERIRHRSHARRSARSMLARAADWLRLYRIRLSIRLESFRWELSQRGIGQLPTGAHRNSRTPAGKTAARLGPAAAWLKPAFAVAAVVAVVVVGVVTLNRMQEAVITPTNSVTSPGHRHPRAGASALASPTPLQSGVSPGLPPTAPKAKSPLIAPVLPSPTCAQTPTPTQSGTPAPTGSPTPTQSNTATATPSATPSATSSPSATPSTGTPSGTAGASTEDKFTPDTGGGPIISCSSTPTPATTS